MAQVVQTFERGLSNVATALGQGLSQAGTALAQPGSLTRASQMSTTQLPTSFSQLPPPVTTLPQQFPTAGSAQRALFPTMVTTPVRPVYTGAVIQTSAVGVPFGTTPPIYTGAPTFPVVGTATIVSQQAAFPTVGTRPTTSLTPLPGLTQGRPSQLAPPTSLTQFMPPMSTPKPTLPGLTQLRGTQAQPLAPTFQSVVLPTSLSTRPGVESRLTLPAGTLGRAARSEAETRLGLPAGSLPPGSLLSAAGLTEEDVRALARKLGLGEGDFSVTVARIRGYIYS